MEESAELIDIDHSIISSEKVKNIKDIDEIGQKLCPYFPGKPKKAFKKKLSQLQY